MIETGHLPFEPFTSFRIEVFFKSLAVTKMDSFNLFSLVFTLKYKVLKLTSISSLKLTQVTLKRLVNTSSYTVHRIGAWLQKMKNWQEKWFKNALPVLMKTIGCFTSAARSSSRMGKSQPSRTMPILNLGSLDSVSKVVAPPNEWPEGKGAQWF